MNEIRMHVERLFQGKVLTEETIELKEEIYGNLVARYEDYVASGMSQAEALEKTKASMTSVEGVLAGEEPAPAAGAAAAVQHSAQTAAADAAAGVQGPGTPQPPAASAQGGTDSAGGQSWFARHKKLVVGVCIGVALVVLLGVVIAVAGEALDDDDDEYGASAGVAQTAPGDVDDADDAYDADDMYSTDDAGNDAAAGGGASQDDADGSSPDGTAGSSTPTQQLRADIDALAASDVAACASAKKLAKALPLSGYLSSVSTAAGTATLAYANIPDACDDDTVETAIALDVATLFAFDTSLDTIEVTTHESDDAEHDADGYTFYRSSVVGNLHSCGALDDNLDSGIYANESTWESFKEAVTAESAVELICETHKHDD